MPALEPNQPPIQCVPGLFLGVKLPGCELNHSPPSSAEIKNERSYISASSICPHVVDRKKKLYVYLS